MATVGLRTITRVDRHKEVSANGIPRYTVTFDNGKTADTAVDAAVSYGIHHMVFRDPMTSPVSVTFDNNGDIIGVCEGQGIQCGRPA